MSNSFTQKKLRFIQYGCGRLGRLMINYLYHRGVQIVGAIDNDPQLVGQDIGELAGLEHKLGVLVSNSPEKVFSSSPADVCVVSIGSLLTQMYPLLSIPLNYGINTITTCEEAFFPWTTSPEFAKRLDLLAKKNYCTLTASGYQDVFAGNLVTTLAGANQKISVLEGNLNYDLEEYGSSLSNAHGLGLTPTEFDQKIASNNLLPSHLWNVAEWLTIRLGWTIKNFNQRLSPIMADQPITIRSLKNKDILAGQCQGMNIAIDLETKEGPIIQLRGQGQVSAQPLKNQGEWVVKGEPNAKINFEHSSIKQATCSTIVNRLPELMVANPGYMTTHNWPTPSYRQRPLSSYLPN